MNIFESVKAVIDFLETNTIKQNNSINYTNGIRFIYSQGGIDRKLVTINYRPIKNKISIDVVLCYKCDELKNINIFDETDELLTHKLFSHIYPEHHIVNMCSNDYCSTPKSDEVLKITSLDEDVIFGIELGLTSEHSNLFRIYSYICKYTGELK